MDNFFVITLGPCRIDRSTSKDGFPQPIASDWY